MIIAYDTNGVVWLSAPGNKVSVLPDVFNGLSLTKKVLTPSEKTEYEALPSARSGATFIGGVFTALPLPPPDPRIAADLAEAEADKADAQLMSTLNATDAQINTSVNAAFSDPAQRQIIKRLIRIAQHAARGRVLR